ITSLRGKIVGQVIAKEQESYYKGRNLVPNPYAENVTTVLLDKGTILNGKPIGARIFVETMDNYSNTATMTVTSSYTVSSAYSMGPPGNPAYGGYTDNYITVDGPIRKRYWNGVDTGK